ncbi:MAG TPA: hypothetical protein VFD94_08020 [Jatrophihabitans sp.]|jgi:hypothetical protein|nr:hypothetical protein [Jatrophihabitans sp.]
MQLYHPGRIPALADELIDTGRQIAARRAALGVAAGQLGWQSSAAGQFQARLAGQLGQLGGLEHRLAELADELRGHGVRAGRRAAVVGHVFGASTLPPRMRSELRGLW